MRFLTWANDPADPRCALMFASAKHFGIDVEPIGVGKEYRGGVSKIEWLCEWLAGQNPADTVVFTDAFDCIYLRDPSSLSGIPLFKVPIVYSAERWSRRKHPDAIKRFQENAETLYCYPNGGSFIGRIAWVSILFHWMLRAMARNPAMPWEQWFLSHAVAISMRQQVRLDQTANLFYCCGGEWRRFAGEVVDGRFRNKRTGTYPYILHAPIPRRSLPIRERIAKELGIIG